MEDINERIANITYVVEKRKYLGMSAIGACAKKLYKQLKEAEENPDDDVEVLTQQQHDIFEVGHLEEPRLLRMLENKLGVEILDTQETLHLPHLKGHLDAVGIDPQTKLRWVFEFKCVKSAKFNQFKKTKDLNSLSETYAAQIHLYMYSTGIPRACFLVRNRDTQEIFGMPVYLEEEIAKAQMQKAEMILTSNNEPMGYKAYNKKPYFCNFCKYRSECWGE